jgi:hypothetical protein
MEFPAFGTEEVLMDAVIHVRQTEKDEAGVFYIGRGSIWGNPYSHIEIEDEKPQLTLAGKRLTIKVADRNEAIKKYRRMLWAKIKAGEIHLPQLAHLHGMKLACYCSPQPCHGDVLVKAAEWAWRQTVDAEAGADEEPVARDYAMLTVKQLKDELRERGLKLSGTKHALVSRLASA